MGRKGPGAERGDNGSNETPGQLRMLRQRIRRVAKVQPEVLALREKLLGIGGQELVMLPLPELNPLVPLQVQRGVLFSLPVWLQVMERSRCHWNVEALWRRNRLFAVFTGYALSEDGLWRGHSWGVRGAMARSRHIVETTEVRLKYFGIALAAKGFLEGLREEQNK